MPNFTTGPSLLPDIGILKYNGCKFSPLFETKVSGNVVKDNAKRTVKYVEYTISVDGYVTLPDGAEDIGATMATLYTLLTAQAGVLIYTGKAFDLFVAPESSDHDVAWGPIPELLEFQPLGGGRSAKVSWKVMTRIVPRGIVQAGGGNVANLAARGFSLLQLNYETSVSYDEAGFSSVSIKGTIEIPMTRLFQKDRTVLSTVDSFRSVLERRILEGIDLGRFHITKRDFNASRDKRTMEWDVEAQEKPYMDLPRHCTIAHGSYGVRPVKSGPGLNNWLCTLKATYTVAGGQPRKTAYWAFLALMFLRMQQSGTTTGDDTPPKKRNVLIDLLFGFLPGVLPQPKKTSNLSPKPWIIDFSVDEGVYLDSRTVSFSATWRLLCRFSQILGGSGVWRKVPEGVVEGKNSRDENNNLWANSMKFGARFGNIMGSKSWLPNELDPKMDVIVDMGSTDV